MKEKIFNSYINNLKDVCVYVCMYIYIYIYIYMRTYMFVIYMYVQYNIGIITRMIYYYKIHHYMYDYFLALFKI